MRNAFPGYFDPNPDDVASLWKDAVIALDTNVLLGLYRWPTSTRQEIFDLLTLVGHRLWVPYHVMVEYHRNRLEAMRTEFKAAQQLERDFRVAYDVFKAVVSSDGVKDRACWDAVSQKLKDTDKSVKELLEIAKAESNNYISPNKQDNVLSFIETLLPGKTGVRPKTQEFVNKAQEEAAARYAVKMGPGYLDAEKAGDQYMFDGLVYDRQYGDFMVWRELVEYCSAKNVSKLLLITSDVKSDWWLDSKSVSGKRPQPELVMEMSRRGKVDNFWMYTLADFLSKAPEYLHAKVTNQAITDVRQAETNATRELRSKFDEATSRDVSIADMRRLLGRLGATLFESGNEFVSGTVSLEGGREDVIILAGDELMRSDTRIVVTLKSALDGLALMGPASQVTILILFAKRPNQAWLDSYGAGVMKCLRTLVPEGQHIEVQSGFFTNASRTAFTRTGILRRA